MHINQDMGCFLINTTSFFLWCLKVWTEDVVTLTLHWEIFWWFYIAYYLLCKFEKGEIMLFHEVLKEVFIEDRLN